MSDEVKAVGWNNTLCKPMNRQRHSGSMFKTVTKDRWTVAGLKLLDIILSLAPRPNYIEACAIHTYFKWELKDVDSTDEINLLWILSDRIRDEGYEVIWEETRKLDYKYVNHPTEMEDRAIGFVEGHITYVKAPKRIKVNCVRAYVKLIVK